MAVFQVCLAQDDVTAERYRRLGARDVRVIGNLKDAAPPLPVNDAELKVFSEQIGTRPCWIAASTHDGEEEIIADAIPDIRTANPTLLTIVAPRHPMRGTKIAEIFAARGFSIARRSELAPLTETDVFIVDTIGELGLFYRLTEIAFIGGSLVAHGGHNPMEAARLGCAIMHGPHMANFASMAATLHHANASIEVSDAATLAARTAELLASQELRCNHINRAETVASQGAAAIDRVYSTISDWLSDPPPAQAEVAHHARA